MAADKSTTFAAPTPPTRPFRRFLRIIEHGFAALGLLLVLLWTLPIIDYIYPRLDRRTPLAPSQYIVCLGGESYRILECVNLLKEGIAPRLIVSNIGPAAENMRRLAIEWGARPDQIVVDADSKNTAEHPAGVLKASGLNPAIDQCVIVTNYLHMARARACFEKAGFRHILMREPRWEPTRQPPRSFLSRMRVLPGLTYEAAAWVEYKVRRYL